MVILSVNLKSSEHEELQLWKHMSVKQRSTSLVIREMQIKTTTHSKGASLVAQLVKNPSAVQETWVWSLGGADPLEKEMATHSSILVWRIPRTEEPGGLQSMGSQELDTT